MRGVVKLLLISALCPAVVCAQGRRGGGGGFGRGGRGTPAAMDERVVLNLVAVLLNLSDMQRQQVQTIFDAADKTAAPIANQLVSSKDSLFDAVRAGKSDSEIKTMAAQQESLRTQILTLQAQTFAKLWALLTNDQKTQVDSFIYDDIGQFLSNATPPVVPSSPPPTGANPTAR